MLSQSEQVREQDVPWTPWAALALWVAGLFGSAIWVTFLIGLYGSNGELDRSVPMLFIGQLPLWAAYGIGPFWLARRFSGLEVLKDTLRAYNPTHVGIAFVAGLVVQIVVIPLVYWPLGSFIDSEKVGEAAEELIGVATTRVDALLLFIMIVLIAPIVEELFFRGIALPSIMRFMGPWPAVLLSSVWFAASHFQAVQFAGLLAVALALAVCRVYSKSLLPPIALHMAFNGITFGLLLSQLELA